VTTSDGSTDPLWLRRRKVSRRWKAVSSCPGGFDHDRHRLCLGTAQTGRKGSVHLHGRTQP